MLKLILAAILSFSALAAHAEEVSAKNMRYQITLMASMMDGLCHAR